MVTWASDGKMVSGEREREREAHTTFILMMHRSIAGSVPVCCRRGPGTAACLRPPPRRPTVGRARQRLPARDEGHLPGPCGAPGPVACLPSGAQQNTHYRTLGLPFTTFRTGRHDQEGKRALKSARRDTRPKPCLVKPNCDYIQDSTGRTGNRDWPPSLTQPTHAPPWPESTP